MEIFMVYIHKFNRYHWNGDSKDNERGLSYMDEIFASYDDAYERARNYLKYNEAECDTLIITKPHPELSNSVVKVLEYRDGCADMISIEKHEVILHKRRP